MRRRGGEPQGLLALVLVALVATLLTIAITWPLFARPFTDVLDARSVYGGAEVLVQRDINLTMWVLAWDAHALVTDPLRVFHANAFYPAPYTLALSEHMLGNAPLFAPVYWVTGNPILAHQMTLLATFALSAVCMAAYLRYWTSDMIAAATGGILFALAPFRVWQAGNLHVVAIQWLPLIPLGIDAVLDRRRPRSGAVVLTLGLALSTLCSYYTGYAAFALAGAYLTLGILVRGRPAFGRALVAGVPILIAGAVVVAVSLPYLWLQRDGIIPVRSGSFVSLGFLGALRAGLAGTAETFVAPIRSGIPQYLGIATLGLALTGLVASPAPARWALLAVIVAGYVLCLGPSLVIGDTQVPLPYRWLAATVPGFSAMRVPQRFGAIVTVAAAALAGLGVASLRQWFQARGRPWLAIGLPLAAVAMLSSEVHQPSLRTLGVHALGHPPPEYTWLAEHGDRGPLIELPALQHDLLRQSVYMFYSTYHWLPVANGYTPYPPRSFTTIMSHAERLPEADALDKLLSAAQFRWVLVHENRLKPSERLRWQALLDARLRLAATFDGARIYEVPHDSAT